MASTKLLRQREDDRSKWDVLEVGEDGSQRVEVVDTPRAFEMTKQGAAIASGEEWGAAARQAEERKRERDGVLAKAGAGAPGMAHALDDNGEPVVASLDTIRQRGWEAVTPEMAAQAGEAYTRRRTEDQTGRTIMPDRPATQVAEMRTAMGVSGPMPSGDLGEGLGTGYAPPVQRRDFRPLSGEALAGAEEDVRRFLETMGGSGRAQPAQARAARPTVAVQQVGDAEGPRPFVSLADSAPASALPPELEGLLRRAADDPSTPAIRPTDSAMASRPTGDEELRAAQERGELLDFLSRAGAGFDDAGRVLARIGGSGRAPPAGLRERPVQDLMQRRAAQRQQEEEARKAARLDPSSAESERARSLVRAAAPDLFNDEELGALTAADLESALDVSRLRASLDESRAAREAANARAEEERKAREKAAADSLANKKAAQADAAAERALRREELAAQRERQGQEREDVRTEKQVESLAKEYSDSGAPGFLQQYQTVKAIMERNPDDLPGFGPMAGRLPDAAISDEGVQLRQSIGQMLAEYRKGVTGAGMSDAERAEYNRITGLLESGTEERVRLGVETLKGAMDARVRATAAGKRPDAVRTYAERNPVFREQVAPLLSGNAAPAAQTPAAAPGRVRVTNGTETLEIDAADLADAKRDGYREVT